MRLQTLADPRPCEVCGEVFRPRLNNVKQGRGKTCSPKCSSAKGRAAVALMDRKTFSYRRTKRGSDHHNYKHGQYVGGRTNWPAAVHARNMVKTALRKGNLVKKPCEHCGSVSKIQAHHTDYSQPLNVQWLCFPCHRALHVSEWAQLAGQRRGSNDAL